MEKIAIIGLSGRYSMSSNTDELWENILRGKELNYKNESQEDYLNVYSKVDNVDMFDNELFGFTPYEAKIIDPQQRVLLECAFEALQNAGYADINKKTCTGVFTSSSISTYLINNILNNPDYFDGSVDYGIMIGNDKDFCSTRLAYKFNYDGPAYTIQCACSSSLVALHKACDSLLNYECDMAVVGGVSITIPQENGYAYKEGGILSADGVCRPFDNDASGTVKGNGCSVIVIKRLEEAQNDGDRILAIISGSAVNNDGTNKIGFTAPSIEGQAAVIKECIEYSELGENSIDYIEAHGTGTKLGDPIEIKALSTVFGDDCHDIAIGSIKANIGHLDVASGLTSVVKSVYMLNNDIIPANINFNKLNKDISFREGLFYFPNENVKRKLNNIGVSSFGIGGTNAHVILSKYTNNESEKKKYDNYLFPISVFRHTDKEELVNDLKSYLSTCDSFEDFIFTYSSGTRKFDKRCYCICKNNSDLINKLDELCFKSNNDSISLPEFSLKDYKYLIDNFAGYMEVYEDICKENYSSDDEEYIYYHAAFLAFLTDIVNDIKVIELSSYDNNLINSLFDETLDSDVKRISVELKNTCKEHDDCLNIFLKFIGEIWCKTDIDYRKLYKGNNWTITNIPLYPLNKKSFWIDRKETKQRNTKEKSSDISFTKENCLSYTIDICKKVLEEDEIDPDSDFYDLGGDSLLLISFIEELNKIFDIKLKLNNFANFNSIREVADFIYESKKEIGEDKFDFLMQIRKGSDKANSLFLIHPVGGTTFCFSMLNKYLSTDVDLNIYTIDLPENYLDYPSIELLAEYYIKAVKSIQSKGKYRLGGYSFGGNVACEMAVQLEKNGEEVEDIIMFDSLPPVAYHINNDAPNEYSESDLIAVLACYFELEDKYLEYIINNPDLKLNDFMKMFKEIKKQEIPLNENEIMNFYNKWKFSHKLLRRHDIKTKINAKGIMYRGTSPISNKLVDKFRIADIKKEEWNSHFKNNITIIDAPGNHHTMLSNADNIAKLAEIFSEQYKTNKK